MLSWYCAWPVNTGFNVHWLDKPCFTWFCGNRWAWSPYARPATYAVANCSTTHRTKTTIKWTRCTGHKRNVMEIGTVAQDSQSASQDSGARTLENVVPRVVGGLSW